MIINSLKLVSWRNYPEVELTFSPKVNVLTGSNGSGKTNIVEAIYFASLGRSWRTSDNKLLVNKNSESCYLKACATIGDFKKQIEISLEKTKRKILINSKPIRATSELSKILNVIVFSPSDVPLFLESPGLRRNFLDASICKVNPIYQDALRTYIDLLEQRNALLKSERIDKDLLSILTQQLVVEANKITKERYDYIKRINEVLPQVMKKLLKKDVAAEITYHPFVPVNETMDESSKKIFEDSLKDDLRLQHTTEGPHREDFDFLLDGNDLASYGSQGQNRLSVLALKLTPYFLIYKEEEKPIVVLDDVTSELDETNSSNLLEFVTSLNQVFITTTNLHLEGASEIDVTSLIASGRD